MKDQKDVQDQKRINLYKTLQKSPRFNYTKRWNCENISADDIAQSAGQVRIENMSNENYVKNIRNSLIAVDDLTNPSNLGSTVFAGTKSLEALEKNIKIKKVKLQICSNYNFIS